MEDIRTGSWVRILAGEHIGRRGVVLDVDGADASVQVEVLVQGKLPIVSVPTTKLRHAGKQWARSFEMWNGERGPVAARDMRR